MFCETQRLSQPGY